jgi:hypothetical protein
MLVQLKLLQRDIGEMTMATAKRTAKTSADLLKDIAATKARLALLEKRAYAGQLDEMIKSTSIVKDFATIQSKVTDISPLAILSAVGAAVGIKRLVLTQSDAVPRKPSAKKAA